MIDPITKLEADLKYAHEKLAGAKLYGYDPKNVRRWQKRRDTLEKQLRQAQEAQEAQEAKQL